MPQPGEDREKGARRDLGLQSAPRFSMWKMDPPPVAQFRTGVVPWIILAIVAAFWINAALLLAEA